MKKPKDPLVGIVMGSKSDLSTMDYSIKTLLKLNIPCRSKIISAHRTPDLLFKYAETASEKGLHVIIAGAGGAAHLPGMIASKTHIPVLGVPIKNSALSGIDSLLSIVQMPSGVPVGTLAIGIPGAINAALLACSILSNMYTEYRASILKYRQDQTNTVLENNDIMHSNNIIVD